MVTRNDLQPIREKLDRVRIIISTIPGVGTRRIVAIDELESAIAALDALISRPTLARTFAAGKARVR